MGHCDAVRFVHCDEEGHLITCAADKTTRVWSISNIKTKDNAITTRASSAQATNTKMVSVVGVPGNILTLSQCGVFSLWTQADGTLSYQTKLDTNDKFTSMTLAYDDDPDTVAFFTTSYKNNLSKWTLHLTSKKMTHDSIATEEGHGEALGKPICCQRTKNRQLIVGFDKGYIGSYPNRKILPETKPVEVTSFIMTNDGHMIHGDVNGVLTYETEDFKITEKIHSKSVTGLVLVNTNSLASCSLDGSIKIWTLLPQLRQIGEYVLASRVPFSCLSCVNTDDTSVDTCAAEVAPSKRRKVEDPTEKWMTLLAGDIEGGLHILDVFQKE